jgi:hypothetical protein
VLSAQAQMSPRAQNTVAAPVKMGEYYPGAGVIRKHSDIQRG